MGISSYLSNVFVRTMTHYQQYHRWFCTDKPNRIKNGYGPDGLYPQERSHADNQEHAGGGMRDNDDDPDELGECAATELRRRWR